VVVTRYLEHLFHKEKQKYFWVFSILSRIRSRIFLGDSGDENGWIYVDGTSRVEVAYMSERASEILILTT